MSCASVLKSYFKIFSFLSNILRMFNIKAHFNAFPGGVPPLRAAKIRTVFSRVQAFRKFDSMFFDDVLLSD